jgi:hypothetical protein
MSDVYSTFKFTNNMMVIFETQCVGFARTQTAMAFKAVTPIILALACLLVWGVSVAAAAFSGRADLRMDKNRMFNVFGSILFTFFGAVAAMALDLFKCNGNPNQERTLASDASIVCYNSDTWQSLLGLSVACVLFYILGLLAVLSWVLYVAMWRYREPEFRARWKFLFIKYRHGAWWWGLVFLFKNFLVNLAFVIMPAPAYQFYFSMITVTVYTFVVMLVGPYRSSLANLFDAICSLSIVYNSSFMASFALLQDAGAETSTVSTLSTAITWSPVPLGLAVLAYLVAIGLQIKYGVGMGPQIQEQRIAAMTRGIDKLRGAFSRLVNLSPEETEQLLKQVSDYELWCFNTVAAVLQVELEQEVASKTSTRQLSIKSMVEVSTQAEQRVQQQSSATKGSDNVFKTFNL